MSTRISRRTWLTTSVPALGGLLLTGCSRETFVPPRVRGGLIGAADVLTMSTNRLLLSGQQLAREYNRRDIADPFPTWNQTNPRNGEYQAHASEGFKNWRLPIGGLVSRPRELSLDEIRSLPARTQITAHICEQGWSAIGEWTGVPLQRVLEQAGGVLPAARYVVIDTQSDAASSTQPSTDKQKNLGRMLVEELLTIGLTDAHIDEHGYVYATVPSNVDKPVPVICLCSHMDTAPDFSGTNRSAPSS